MKLSSEHIKNCLSRIFTASFRECIVPKTKMVCYMGESKTTPVVESDQPDSLQDQTSGSFARNV